MRENMRWPGPAKRPAKSPAEDSTVWFATDIDPDFDVMGRSFNAVRATAPDDGADIRAVLQDLMTRVGAGRAVSAQGTAAGRPVLVVATGESDWHADSLKVWTMREAARLVVAKLAADGPAGRYGLLVAVIDADKFFAAAPADPFAFPDPDTLPPAPKEPACT